MIASSGTSAPWFRDVARRSAGHHTFGTANVTPRTAMGGGTDPESDQFRTLIDWIRAHPVWFAAAGLAFALYLAGRVQVK